ncbi:MAG: WXG100 family type VII secretion target [Anaerolineales bacterium]|nr:WXG100 family type VII secretion target [Anaerolineales bacterium]
MTDEIRVVYPDMEEMSRTFKQGAEQLKDTLQEMQNLATVLEDGALLGNGGQAFVEAIRGKLCPAINKLSAKFNELDGDIRAAVRYAQEADRQSKGMF